MHVGGSLSTGASDGAHLSNRCNVLAATNFCTSIMIPSIPMILQWSLSFAGILFVLLGNLSR